MKYFKSLGLCIVAVFALGAVAAATASAEGPTILFPNGGGAKPQFSSKTGKGNLVTTLKGEAVEVKCEEGRNLGEAVPGTDRVKNVKITFKKCTGKIKGVATKCGAAPAGENETITTSSLEGQLGYIHVGTPLTVGLVLKSESELFAEFHCSVDTVRVKGNESGGIIGEVSGGSLNKLIDPGTAGLLSYKQKAGEPTVQVPNELTVLGTLVKGLLLRSLVTGGTEFELAGLEEEKPVELFFLESVLISS